MPPRSKHFVWHFFFTKVEFNIQDFFCYIILIICLDAMDGGVVD